MRASDLRERVEIHTTADNRSWSLSKTVWARVKETTEADQVDLQHTVANSTLVLTLRYTSIGPSDRIKYGGNYYEIRTIEPDERKAYVTITVETPDNGN